MVMRTWERRREEQRSERAKPVSCVGAARARTKRSRRLRCAVSGGPRRTAAGSTVGTNQSCFRGDVKLDSLRALRPKSAMRKDGYMEPESFRTMDRTSPREKGARTLVL